MYHSQVFKKDLGFINFIPEKLLKWIMPEKSCENDYLKSNLQNILKVILTLFFLFWASSKKQLIQNSSIIFLALSIFISIFYNFIDTRFSSQEIIDSGVFFILAVISYIVLTSIHFLRAQNGQ